MKMYEVEMAMAFTKKLRIMAPDAETAETMAKILFLGTDAMTLDHEDLEDFEALATPLYDDEDEAEEDDDEIEEDEDDDTKAYIPESSQKPLEEEKSIEDQFFIMAHSLKNVYDALGLVVDTALAVKQMIEKKPEA